MQIYHIWEVHVLVIIAILSLHELFDSSLKSIDPSSSSDQSVIFGFTD